MSQPEITQPQIDRVLSAVTDGSSSKQIASSAQLDIVIVRLALVALKERKLIHTIGKTRATRYFRGEKREITNPVVLEGQIPIETPVEIDYPNPKTAREILDLWIVSGDSLSWSHVNETVGHLATPDVTIRKLLEEIRVDIKNGRLLREWHKTDMNRQYRMIKRA